MYKNTIYNIVGILIPGLISIPVMAFLARILNPELFGILMLCFSILGYSGLFDAGLSRAVIRKIATLKDIEIERVVMGTALTTVIIISFIAMILMFFCASKITHLLNVSAFSYNEVQNSIKYIALTIPLFLITTISLAYIEGRQDFFLLNKINIFNGVIVSVLPLLALLLKPTLVAAILGLLVSRIITVIVSLYFLEKKLVLSKLSFNKLMLRDLISFGGWITISNIISPLMVYFDRFILSNILGANNVAYYIGPTSLVQKLGILPIAISKTLFPFFSENRNSNKAKNIEKKAYLILIISSFLIAFPLFMFSSDILSLWLGSEYGEKAYRVFQILLIGFFFNSIAQIPFARVQALGWAKVTAYIHLFEVIPYMIFLYYGILNGGLIGAAIVWSLRMFFDFIVLEFFSRKLK